MPRDVPKVIIFTSEDEARGSGHVSRQIEVAREFGKRGMGVTVVGKISRSSALRIKRLKNCEVVITEKAGLDSLLAASKKLFASVATKQWLILDDYQLLKENFPTSSTSGPRQIHFIDWPGCSPRAQIVVNAGCGSFSDVSCCDSGHGLHICGTQAAIVGKRFRLLRYVRTKLPRIMRRLVLINFGASDATDKSREFVDTVTKAKLGTKAWLILGKHYRGSLIPGRHLGGRVFVTRSQVQFWIGLVLAKLAIGGAGVSAFERSFLGLPAINFVLADNQKAIAALLSELGCSIDASGNFGEDLVANIQRMSRNAEQLRSMTNMGKKYVDGLGAKRLAEVVAKFD